MFGEAIDQRRRGGLEIVAQCLAIRWLSRAGIDGGKHVLEPGTTEVPLQILSFNGTLLHARWTSFTLEIEYESQSRASALLNTAPARSWVDGREPVVLSASDHTTLILPRGHHKVVIQAASSATSEAF